MRSLYGYAQNTTLISNVNNKQQTYHENNGAIEMRNIRVTPAIYSDHHPNSDHVEAAKLELLVMTELHGILRENGTVVISRTFSHLLTRVLHQDFLYISDY